jgi:hypothetical protein
MKHSKHSKVRCQQRCIPPIVQGWLDEFGEERYQKHGTVRVSFNRDSVKAMRRKMGRHFLQKNKKYLNAYRVETLDGIVITTGWKTGKFNRYH